MNDVMSFISSLGTVQILGIGGVVIAVAGYTGLKIVKNKNSYKNLNIEQFQVKADIHHKDSHKNSDSEFNPDTYTVNTEEYNDKPKRMAGPILRPHNNVSNSIEDFLNDDLPFSGSASDDHDMRNRLEAQNNNNEQENTSDLILSQDNIPKNLTANKESLEFIQKAFDEDRLFNKEKAIEYINLATFKESNSNEKMRFSTILKNYNSREDTLISLFEEYPSFLSVGKKLNHLDFTPNEHSSDYNNEKQDLTQFNYESSQSVDKNSFINLGLDVPKITLPSKEKTTPRLLEKTILFPEIQTNNDLNYNFQQLNSDEGQEDIVNIFQNISKIQSTQIKENNMNQQNSKLTEDFNSLLNNLKDDNNSSSTKTKKEANSNKMAYDIWVQWMTTANGKTSFKSSMYKLKNPWTSRKAIIELSENITDESKNSNGTNAAWSVISVQPFFDF